MDDMTTTPRITADEDAFYYEPNEPGWYAYTGGAQSMIFHLRGRQWSAHLDNGSAADCEWGYIHQALGVWNLVKIDLPEPPPPPITVPREKLDALREALDNTDATQTYIAARSLLDAIGEA